MRRLKGFLYPLIRWGMTNFWDFYHTGHFYKYSVKAFLWNLRHGWNMARAQVEFENLCMDANKFSLFPTSI